jgi:purine-binding chemotaxis protein CheW
VRRRTTTQKAPIDWAVVRARLATAMAATERAFETSSERTRQVLDERAQALARAPESLGPLRRTADALTFTLARERYCIECRYVREVLRLTNYTHVPATPEFLMGVTNARGEILSIVDLGRLLGVEARGVTDLSRLIVLGVEQAEFGVLVDDVREVQDLKLDEIGEVPEGIAGVGHKYLRGISADAALFLDGERLLRDRNLFVDHMEPTGRQATARRGVE